MFVLISDIAPEIDCPTLEGPVAVDGEWIEFYCIVNSNVTDLRARYDIKFMFDGTEFAIVPIFTTAVPGQLGKVTLNEQYLLGKLGKWVCCRRLTCI